MEAGNIMARQSGWAESVGGGGGGRKTLWAPALHAISFSRVSVFTLTPITVTALLFLFLYFLMGIPVFSSLPPPPRPESLPFRVSFTEPRRGLVMLLTDTAMFASHRHSHISLHISSLPRDIFIFLSLHLWSHAAASQRARCTAGLQKRHYDHLSLSAFSFLFLFFNIIIIFYHHQIAPLSWLWL